MGGAPCPTFVTPFGGRKGRDMKKTIVALLTAAFAINALAAAGTGSDHGSTVQAGVIAAHP
ncbi:hypothetical protein Snoj_29010 [Streptomyces nojiriensis]|uniref:Uncharacterized protein n=1 Tax=Streptomyces nojiriensis TaxID=66374 RepID=A0ABQ3SLH8_9ACTN|nr:hypothetical protein GCM10010205_79470 [Streptomyces nojiriensis]GHI68983.1 hypothetical protein Snoj_29010 [Streptomyces nojiriensis]